MKPCAMLLAALYLAACVGTIYDENTENDGHHGLTVVDPAAPRCIVDDDDTSDPGPCAVDGGTDARGQ